MTWTEERVKRLKSDWQVGYSGSQIANRMGGLTRSAVIGKANRLGLKARAVRIGKKTVKKKYLTKNEKIAIVTMMTEGGSTLRQIAIAIGVKDTTTVSRFRQLHGIAPRPIARHERPEPVIEYQEEVLVPLDERKGVQELGPHDCKWPIGDPKRDDDFHFCGDRQQTDSVYCEFHHKKAHTHDRNSKRLVLDRRQA